MEEMIYERLSAALSCAVKWGFVDDGDEMPLVTLSIVSGSRGKTLTGRGLRSNRIQVDCWGETYAQALAVKRKVSDSLDGYRDGPLLNCHLEMERSGNSVGEQAIHRHSLQFSVKYRD